MPRRLILPPFWPALFTRMGAELILGLFRLATDADVPFRADDSAMFHGHCGGDAGAARCEPTSRRRHDAASTAPP